MVIGVAFFFSPIFRSITRVYFTVPNNDRREMLKRMPKYATAHDMQIIIYMFISDLPVGRKNKRDGSQSDQFSAHSAFSALSTAGAIP